MAAPDRIPQSQRDILFAILTRRIPMPRTPRAVFRLLARMEPDQTVDQFLELVDFTGVTPIDIYMAVLGRAPEAAIAALPTVDYNPATHFRAALLSIEFRRLILRNILTAFPEKGRDVFIHVPKCAGTDLIFNLATRMLPLPKMLDESGWLTDTEFLTVVAGICRMLPFHDRFFVYGHMELGAYVYSAGVRSVDRIFTVLRDPIDQMLSQANYAIGRLRQDPLGNQPDTAKILQYLGIPRLPADIDAKDLKALAARALLNPEISRPNRACTFLGRRMEGLYATAIDQIVVNNVEVTTTAHYERWLKQRWEIGRSERHNRSDVILSRSEMGWLYTDVVREQVAEDYKLFNTVTWALEQTGGVSVTGLEIARLAGAWLMDGVPPPPTSTPDATVSLPGESNLLVAQKADAVALCLAIPPAASPEAPRMDTILTVDCSEKGQGRDHLLVGWSRPEKNFTWTNGRDCSIQLPSLPLDGVYILRLMGRPFVRALILPEQRIELLVNDVDAGFARMSDIGVIEYEIPVWARNAGQPLNLTLRLPNATRPIDIIESGDDRILAFALYQIVVYHIKTGVVPLLAI